MAGGGGDDVGGDERDDPVETNKNKNTMMIVSTEGVKGVDGGEGGGADDDDDEEEEHDKEGKEENADDESKFTVNCKSKSKSKSEKDDEYEDGIRRPLRDVVRRVEGSLLPSIEGYTNERREFHPVRDGLDFLHAKNTLLLSYLIDWTLYMRSNRTDREVRRRLSEMKIVLERIRPMEKRMRYQLEKLLSMGESASSSSEFVTGDVPNQYDDDDDDDDVKMKKDKKNDKKNDNGEKDDPLSFRPNLDAMEDEDDEEDRDEEDEYDDDDDDDEEENSDVGSDADDKNEMDDDHDDQVDDDLALATATLKRVKQSSKNKKIKTKGGKKKPKDSEENHDHNQDDEEKEGRSRGGVYRPPRFAAVPYTQRNGGRSSTGDPSERDEEEAERVHLRRMRTSELAATLREQYDDRPDVEDAHGGAERGRHREEARRFAERERRRIEFEEGAMIRLAVSRTERKERRRIMRNESSNLDAMAGDLGSIVRGVREAFLHHDQNSDIHDDHFIGGSDGRDHDNDNDGTRTSRMSRKHRTTRGGHHSTIGGGNGNGGNGRGGGGGGGGGGVDGTPRGQKRKKKFEPKNTYQKALYGGGESKSYSSSSSNKKRKGRKTR